MDTAQYWFQAASDYQIERSLRFNSADSAYLNRTPASAGNRKTWSVSFWLKRSALGTYQMPFSCYQSTGGALALIFNTDNTLEFYQYNAAYQMRLVTSQVFRDPSSWYHFVFSVDTTQATASNRVKIYVNGTQITAFSTATYPTQDDDLIFNYAQAHAIGMYAGSNQYYFDGLITEFHNIDGQALTPSSFGETDTITGVWKPKKYDGTYGTNGFYLNFADNSGITSTTLGKDSSGNGNNWTPNNFSVTAGSGNDSMIDVPTPYADGGNGRGNYATLNPLDANGGNFFNGNLEYTGVFSTFSSQNGHGCRSTLRVRPSGKWYVEAANVTYSGSGNSCMLGFTSSTQEFTATAFGVTLTPWIGVDASVFNNRITLQWNGVSGGTASATQLFASYASGDVVNFAIDFDAGKFWVGKNGTWYNSGDPAAGTNATSTFTAGSSDWAFWGEYVVSSDNSNRGSVLVNFGQRSFSSTPPSGFLALNTQNLPEPSIKKPNSYMDVVTWTGNGSAQTISSLGFSPDFIWIKDRNTARSHYLANSIIGGNNYLSSDSTSQELTTTEGVKSITSNGFTLGYALLVNNTSETYAAWCWDKSATPGFDIVTYTGNGTNRTIAHSLGVAPSMIIVKERGNANDWPVYHASTGNLKALYLNLTNGQGGDFAGAWNSTSPTSSVFSLGTSVETNSNTGTFVAYLWSEVAGFSKFGSYTGNGSTDGPFVYCGFRPRWVMIKSSSIGGSNWRIFDTARDPANVMIYKLSPNNSDAEYTDASTRIDFTSNGFKLREIAGDMNSSGATYVFAAFAETPAKYALAR